MTAQPQAAPVDAETATRLDVIATDRVHEDDRAKVEAAIRETAAANGGVVSPNALRALLYNGRNCLVYPRTIGATFCAMKHAGQLEFDGWEITEGSPRGNDGKPARRYRLTT